MSDEGVPFPVLPLAPESYERRNESEFRGMLQRYFTDASDALVRVIADTATDIAGITQGITLIEEQTPSAAASADFTTGIDATYDEYVFVLTSVVPATDAVVAWVRTSTDGGSTFDSGASDYAWSNNSWVTADASHNSTADSELVIHGNTNVGSDTNENGISGRVRLYAPSDTTYTRLDWQTSQVNGGGNIVTSTGAGERLSAADVDAKSTGAR